MYINITASEMGDNKGSSGTLVHYLDKENRLFKPEEPSLWFTGNSSSVQSYEVKNRLDNNIAKLCKDDAKFFLININPSQKEISHLKQLYGESGVEVKLKEYAVKIMDEYARNFKKDNIQSNADLLWFGKLEHHRYYSHKDKEVKSGQVKRGALKPGEQMHVQVVVSRKDITNKIRLSPMNKSRGKNTDHSKKLGQFDRVAFKNAGERIFDQQFDFQRPISETFAYANTRAKGTLEQRMIIASDAYKKVEAAPSESKLEMLDSHLEQKDPMSYLEMLLDRQDNDPVNNRFKRKRRKKVKGQNNNQGLGR